MFGDPAAACHRVLSRVSSHLKRFNRAPTVRECLESPVFKSPYAAVSRGRFKIRHLAQRIAFRLKTNSSPQTLRGTLLSVPLECCLLVVRSAYFFFAAFFTAFLAAFFAGAFLAAFLVAICLFSLFDGLHRFCNYKLQLKNV
jgi:hypothetical protein